MADPESPIERKSARGCNLIALIILLLVLLVFVASLFLSRPNSGSQPYDTGVPPTGPSGQGNRR